MRKQPPAKRRRKHKLGKQRKSIFKISCKCETKIGKLLMRVFSLLSLPQQTPSSAPGHTHMRGLVYVKIANVSVSSSSSSACHPQVDEAQFTNKKKATKNSTPSFKFICANLLSHSIKSNPINKHLK